jgi:hypothetical protein
VAEADRLLDPAPAVPIFPVPLAKVGVTVVPVPAVIVPLVATRLVATGAATTVTRVVAVFDGSSSDVAVRVMLPGTAGAVQLLPTQVPPVLLQVMVPRNPPVTVLLKVVLVATVRVGVPGLIAPTTTACGAMVVLAST